MSVRRSQHIEVLQPEPDERGRFYVLVDGFMEWWALDKITSAVAEGANLTARYDWRTGNA